MREVAKGWLQAAGVMDPTEQEIDQEVLYLSKEMDRLDWEDWVISQGLESYGSTGPEYPGLGKW